MALIRGFLNFIKKIVITGVVIVAVLYAGFLYIKGSSEEIISEVKDAVQETASEAEKSFQEEKAKFKAAEEKKAEEAKLKAVEDKKKAEEEAKLKAIEDKKKAEEVKLKAMEEKRKAEEKAKTPEEELEEQFSDEQIRNFQIEKMDMDRITNNVCEIVAAYEDKGMLQSDLWKKLKLSNRDGSRLALRLERRGLIYRQMILQKIE